MEDVTLRPGEYKMVGSGLAFSIPQGWCGVVYPRSGLGCKGLVLKSRADGACVYLDENNLCRLNPVKPDKCRSFPFEWTNPDSNAICPELASAGV